MLFPDPGRPYPFAKQYAVFRLKVQKLTTPPPHDEILPFIGNLISHIF